MNFSTFRRSLEVTTSGLMMGVGGDKFYFKDGGSSLLRNVRNLLQCCTSLL